MKSYLNIQIDGTAYGEKIASKPNPWRMPAGLPGIATASTPDNPDNSEEVRKAATNDYEERVLDVLHQISDSRSGDALIKEIHRLRRSVTIIPLLPKAGETWFKGDEDWRLGSNRPLDETAATRKHWLKRNSDGDVYNERGRGTGTGSACEIEFITPRLAAPILERKPLATRREEPNPLALSDEILVHELLHALRDLAGVRSRRRVPRQPHYDNFEEFYAIVVANVYRSECGRGGVRNDNHGALEAMYVDGKNFLNLHFNRTHLRRFCRQHETFAAELSKIPTYFNPFQHLRI